MKDKFSLHHYYFSDISDNTFQQLMKKRIYKILLISSKYDAFMLEEDGRIDEQLFNEYTSLSLRYPPQFIQASSREEALEILEEEKIDLIITMLSIGNIDPFALSLEIKQKYTKIPIVVLTPFSREVSLRLMKEDMSAIDYVFCWLGNADILLAIVKLIEDKMNVDYDSEVVGVQAILLVEDSIRFYSSYLPLLYKLIFTQSKEFMTEGLNEHQKMLRMRGRPKILLARSYEEAINYYERYKKNLLGIISDVSFSKDGVKDSQAGIKLVQKVKEDDIYMPILLQSSDNENEKIAKQLNVGFINKNSKNLLNELKEFVRENFAFGDFVFINPQTGEEVGRAADLKSLQEIIFQIPDESLDYHISHNHFSKWLRARALFPIAELFRQFSKHDFSDLDELRRYIFDTIATYRQNKGRGVIAEFNRNAFDEYLIYTRIGEKSLGGKARGLAFIDSLIKRHHLYDAFNKVIITIPRTVVLTTDIFDEFMSSNNLYEIALSDNLSDEEILRIFVSSRLPTRIHQDLLIFLSYVKNPIAVRSSSLLEDSHYQPFAGIYNTYMVPRIKGNDVLMMEKLSIAIKSVYASVFFKASKSYMTATSNVIDEEKMAIVLQEVCGTQNDNLFYPTISGVARSINFYPIEPEKPEDGIANIAFGLGKYIVDGGSGIRFSPKYPKKIIQLSSPELALRDSQKYFYALDLDYNKFIPSVDDSVNILKLPIKVAQEHRSFKYVCSVYDYENNIIRDGSSWEGKKIITFSQILNYNIFPLAEILQKLLEIGQKEMGTAIEIEFAVNIDVPPNHPAIFNFLQIRPIVDIKETINLDINSFNKNDCIIISHRTLGNGEINNIFDIVYIKPETFNKMNNPKIALQIEKLNDIFLKENRHYILIGPGRWGSSEPTLGIPVKWAQISAARVIVESGLHDYRVDPSQGTHFFQNLTSFKVGYFTINPFINDGYYDLNFLNSFPSYYEDEHIRHVRFNSPVVVKIDGKNNKGVILKPKII